ncbi:Leu/Phe/Val dehydrogenase [Thermaerobacter litoralis]
MSIFEAMAAGGHRELVFCYDPAAGLRAVMAVHDTTLGPGLGGCRMWPYSSEEEVVQDALRLSQGMTAKSALAGVNYGGAKVVIWGDPGRDKSEALFRALGRFVHTLGGLVITGTDAGTNPEDFVAARWETPYLVGLPPAFGGSGDSSETTAYGVFVGIQACLEEVYGDADLRGRRVAVQGCGKVGSKLVRRLVEAGAEVTVTDVDPAKARAVARPYGLRVVDADAIYDEPCDVFAPCALGGVINDATIPRLRCRVVAGAANNQLEAPRHAAALQDRQILYAPDYVINAGGLIQVADELDGFDRDRVMRKTAAIGPMLRTIFRVARERSITTLEAAEWMVRRRLAGAAALRTFYRPGDGLATGEPSGAGGRGRS